MTSTTQNRPIRVDRPPEHHANSGDYAKLCLASSAELTTLRTLIAASIRVAPVAGGHFKHCQPAMALINQSMYQTNRPIERIEHGLALVGDRWLHGLAFLQTLAEFVQSRSPAAGTPEANALKKKWKETVFIANAAETIARVSGNSDSLHAWLAGLLLGSLEMSAALMASGPGQSPTRAAKWQGPNALDLSRLLTALELQSEFQMSTPHERPLGPWSALSTAHQAISISRRVAWASNCLSCFQRATLPPGLSVVVGRRLAELQQSSFGFAELAWDHLSEA